MGLRSIGGSYVSSTLRATPAGAGVRRFVSVAHNVRRPEAASRVGQGDEARRYAHSIHRVTPTRRIVSHSPPRPQFAESNQTWLYPRSPKNSTMTRGGSLKAGEPVLLIDRKKRRYLIDLAEGGEFHSHSGVLAHDKLIGKAEGETYRSTLGMVFIALRPTITDYVLKMPRGAQVVYPKDIGPILVQADIFPGARVLESDSVVARCPLDFFGPGLG